MQKSIIAILVAVVVVLAVALIRDRQENRRLDDATRTLGAALNESKQLQQQAAARAAVLSTEIDALRTRLAERREALKVAKQGNAATPPADSQAPDAKGPDFMGRFAEMMQKPEMQEAMRAQQRLMLPMLYGALFKKLKLSPEALDQLKEIQLDKQMAGMAMMAKGDKTAQMAALTEARREADQAVKELLGDEQFALYQDYEATVGERLQIGQLNQQLTDKGMPLDEVQQEELITLIIEERAKLGVPSGLDQQAAWANGMPSSETFEKLLQQQQELNQRVYARSNEFLSEAQQAELQAYQNSQIQAQRLGLQMMQGMAGEKNK